MDKVTARPDSAPHARCPTCEQTSSAGILRTEDGLYVADYRCAAGHIWTTKWLVSA